MLGLYRAAYGWEEGKKVPHPKICRTHPKKAKPGTVIPYLKEIQKKYESFYTLPDFG